VAVDAPRAEFLGVGEQGEGGQVTTVLGLRILRQQVADVAKLFLRGGSEFLVAGHDSGEDEQVERQSRRLAARPTRVLDAAVRRRDC